MLRTLRKANNSKMARNQILLILTLLNVNIILGQIAIKQSISESFETIGEVDLFGGVGSTINGSASLLKISGKDEYVLTFQDQSFKAINASISIRFLATEKELDFLFDELKSCYLSPKEEYSLAIGEDLLMFSNPNSNVIHISSREGYFFTTAAGLYILFGKEWNRKDFKSFLKG